MPSLPDFTPISDNESRERVFTPGLRQRIVWRLAVAGYWVKRAITLTCTTVGAVVIVLYLGVGTFAYFGPPQYEPTDARLRILDLTNKSPAK